jgi:hypothetical protein
MQGVLVFASAAARDAAITSPQEGQCCYLKDTDAVLTYSGAAWVGFDDSNAIQNSIVDAKGDLVAASGADTPARLAVGNNGETLVADSSTSTGLRYQATTAAGKNGIINGGFDVWQRGTSGTTRGYTCADRYFLNNPGVAGRTYSRQASDLTGFQYFMRMQRTAGNTATDGFSLSYNLESADSYRFAGQTVTLSWWMRKGATYSGGALRGALYSGTGIDQNVDNAYTGAASVVGFSQTPTTSWVRYSITGTVSSSATELAFSLVWDPSGTAGATDYLDLTGFQLEIGSVATQFMRTGGNIQGELAACQRYYTRESVTTTYAYFRSSGNATNTTQARIIVPLLVQMRTKPAAMDTGGSLAVSDGVNLYTTGSFVLSANSTTQNAQVEYTHGSAVFTQFRYESLQDNNNGATYLGFSAEL